jgi:hypothetical protein
MQKHDYCDVTVCVHSYIVHTAVCIKRYYSTYYDIMYTLYIAKPRQKSRQEKCGRYTFHLI